MSKRLLVTGGAGFIGANFVRYCLAHRPDYHLLVLDALTYAGRRESLPAQLNAARCRFVQGDIRDQALVESLLVGEDIDTLVNFAAESHVDRSIGSPQPFIDTNVLGTFHLLEAARKVWLSGSGKPHRFHQISTDEVYGSLGMDDASFTEESCFKPNSPYSASKASADHLVRAYQQTYGLATSISACSNNYGPRQFPEKLIPLFIINALHGKPLPVYGDGRNVRDWLYVDDHCRLLLKVLEDGQVGHRYNIAGASEVSNMEIVLELCGLIDRAFSEDARLTERFPKAAAVEGKTEYLIHYVKDRLGHDLRYSLDDSLSAEALGFDAREPLAQGLAKTLAWYLENESWWRAICETGAAISSAQVQLR